MTKILAKQISNVLDVDSNQTVTGRKTFENTVNFKKNASAYHLVIEDGFVYWLATLGLLEEEGNHRMGIVDSVWSTEKYFEGTWQKV